MLNQAARYSPVVDLLASKAGGRLLEVGSGSRGIADFVDSRWSVVACDRSFDDYGSPDTGSGGGAERVVGDVLSLPFGNRSFDAVVALDLLEHVARHDRARALDELGRVTDGVAIVGCPTGTAALEADRRLAARYRRLRQTAPGWLVEHIEKGFPEPEELSDGLQRYGSVRLMGNEAVRTHAAITTLEALPVLGHISLFVGRVLRPPNSGLRARVLLTLRGGDRLPTYRTIAVMHRYEA